MSELGDFWRDVKEAAAEHRAANGIPCPHCLELTGHANLLLPGERCRMHNFRAQRPTERNPK